MVAEPIWQSAIAGLPLLAHLEAAERERLRELTARFLQLKSFDAKGDLEPDPGMCATIAVQACLPILYLGLDYYREWQTVIVYPEGFVAPREHIDDSGVAHLIDEPLVGEAWERGPLVLSWHDVLCRGEGFNVVIHECAHKLDMLNGAVNGFPPLHSDMDPAWWSRVLKTSYDAFCRQVDAGDEVIFDPYAASDPSEFFAVLSEAFFELPQTLRAVYPRVYRQFTLFYRQDPARMAPVCAGGS